MIKVPDAASIATIYWLEQLIGRKVGPSTGTNLFGILNIAEKMHQNGETGSLVTLLCDSGDRYLDTYYDAQWVEKNIGQYVQYQRQLAQFSLTGQLGT